MFKRCEICTNCGRCGSTPAAKKDTAVITSHLRFEGERNPENSEKRRTENSEKRNLENSEKRRLVTVDIGTTTIAMQLYDRHGRVTDTYARLNPQSVYGADVLSRIKAAEERGKAVHMQKLIYSEIQKGTERFRMLLEEGETFFFVVVGNTTMVYLFMGWDPACLGKAPFEACYLDSFFTTVTTYEYPAFVLMGLSAFVGGDIVAGAYALRLLQKKELTLLIDLGTNGEMILGNQDGAIALSTAAGPAFEGGANRGIWGSDMISLTATLLQMGILDEDGTLKEPYFQKGIRIGDVLVTQESVRTLQYAKAAIASGIQILMQKRDCTAGQIESVVLAGGFGYFLSPKAATQIGLLPQKLTSKTVVGGNTALAGAYVLGSELIGNSELIRAMMSELLTKKDEKAVFAGKLDLQLFDRTKVEMINLAMEDNFSESYISAIQLKPIQ